MSDLNFIETDAGAILEQILTALENGVQEPLYPGDERRIFGEVLSQIIVSVYSAVNDACRQKLLRYARGEVLDAIGETRGVDRIDSAAATTTMRFSIASAISSNITIPAGTRVTADYSRYFHTDATAVIPAGSLYVDIPATADEGGEEYNDIAAGGIRTLVDLIPYIDSVSNETITSGGGDEEDDESYRERIRLSSNAITTAGSEAAYRYWALSADSLIADVYVGSPSPCEIVVVPLMAGGELPGAEILQKVSSVLDADDVRPMGDHVTVQAPTTVSYDINIKYYTTSKEETECTDAIEGDGGSIDQYIYWQGTRLGRDINPDYLRKLILSPQGDSAGKPGAWRVDILSPAYRSIPDTAVAVFSGNLTVSHEIISAE